MFFHTPFKFPKLGIKTRLFRGATLLVGFFGVFTLCYYSLITLNAQLKNYLTYPKTAQNDSKSYTKQEVKVEGGEYDFKYTFKNHKGDLTNWTWRFKKEYMDDLTNQFGISKEVVESNPTDAQGVFKRKMAITNGLFVELEGKIEPNYHAITDVHNIVAAPLYELAKRDVEDAGGGKSEIIELLLKFCQDLPVKDIPEYYNDRLVQGIFPPSLSLVKGFGDCDTKAMIFASALANDEVFKTVVIYTPNHVLIGVRGVPKPYQTAIKYKGESYIVCQPAGPDRFNFGQRAEDLGAIQMVRGL
jgi:hypothetical protein